MFYDLYAGLSGSFGGATYQGTYEYDSFDEALSDAEMLAIEKYYSEEGHNGLRTWYDIREELNRLCPNDDFDDEDYHYYYMEHINNWITYYAVPHNGNTDELPAESPNSQ